MGRAWSAEAGAAQRVGEFAMDTQSLQVVMQMGVCMVAMLGTGLVTTPQSQDAVTEHTVAGGGLHSWLRAVVGATHVAGELYTLLHGEE